MPPSREFPEGRWFNHTVNSKDQWVGENAERWITLRLQLERDKTLRSQQTNEFGDDGRILKRFAGRSDCVNAFRNLFCWTNFPRCDKDRDLSFPTCRSSCENFFISCGIERGLWRCGKSKYFNGYSPESPTVTPLGNVSYLRDFYPGQPFRQNKYTRNRNEIPICTPAMTGSSSSFRIKFNILAVLVMILLALYFYL